MNTENEKPETRLASKIKKKFSIFVSPTVIFVLLGLLFFLLSYGLESYKQEHKDVIPLVLDLVVHLLRDISIALLIVAIATFTIERWHKEAIHELLNDFLDKFLQRSDTKITSFIESAEKQMESLGKQSDTEIKSFIEYAEKQMESLGKQSDTEIKSFIEYAEIQMVSLGKQSDTEIKSFRDSAEEQIKLVGTNFIHAAYGKSMPPELFTVVEESIFKADFIRSSIVIWVELNNLSECYLKVIQGDIKEIFKPFLDYYENCMNLQNGGVSRLCIEELVAVRTSLSYKVTNVSSVEKSYPILVDVDVPFAGCLADKQGVKPISVRVNINDTINEYITKVVENSVDTERLDPTKVIFEWESVTVQPNEVIDIQILLYSIRRKRDQEMWSFRDPCKGIEIGVEDCNGDKEIYLELMASVKETNAQKNSKTNMAWLKTEKFILPYQGAKIKWKPQVDVCPIGKINS